MSPSLTLVDGLALRHLQVHLPRAGRIEEGSVRLIAGGGILAVYVAVIYPIGLLDEVPTVLGLRTFALSDTAPLDAVVPIRALLERVNRLDAEMKDASASVTMTVPMGVNTVTWAAISPPKGGWSLRTSTTMGV